MTRTVTCTRNSCGTEFDPYRTPATPGADTSRCSTCGQQHDVPPEPPQSDIATDGAGLGTTVEIHAAPGSKVIVQPDGEGTTDGE